MAGAAEHLASLEHGGLEILVLDLELPEPELPELTITERAVALRVADGLGNAEIASERGVALRTITNQVRSIFQKLGVCSRWDLALLLTRRSLEATARSELPSTRPRRAPPAPARSGVLNSPATVGVLRAAYASVGADLDEVRAQRGFELVGEGALHREDYCALFEELAAMTGQRALGLDLARDLAPGALGLLQWLALSAPTLGDGLRVVSEHGGLLHAGGRRVTRSRGDQLALAYWVDGARPPPRVVLDWSFGCLYERVRAIAGAALEPLAVQVQYADPGDRCAEDFFGCPVRFGAAANEIVLPREIAEICLPGSDPELFAMLTRIARARVSATRAPTLASRTRETLQRALASGHALRPVSAARRLGISASALERGLSSAGERFEDLAADARIDLALRPLERRGATLAHVATALKAAARSAG